MKRERRHRDPNRDALAHVLAESEQIAADVQQITAQLEDVTALLAALADLDGVADE